MTVENSSLELENRTLGLPALSLPDILLFVADRSTPTVTASPTIRPPSSARRLGGK